MIRALAKTAVAFAYSHSGLLLNRRAEDEHLPFIVGYHRVVESFEHSSRTAIPSMLISIRTLEKHLDWIAARYRIASLDEIGERLASGRPFERPIAAITFDDGYADMYCNAFPLLKRKGIPAAVFVVTAIAGTSTAPVYDWLYLLLRRLDASSSLRQIVPNLLREIDVKVPDRLLNDSNDAFSVLSKLLDNVEYANLIKLGNALEAQTGSPAADLAEMTPLTWEMIRTMSNAGITIGSHTSSHALLTSESPSTAVKELTESRRTIEAALNVPVRHFAYPNGSFNASVVRAVHDAGYRYAYGICLSRDKKYPLLTIPRRVLWERACVDVLGRFSPSIMRCQAHGVFESRQVCIHDHGVQAA